MVVLVTALGCGGGASGSSAPPPASSGTSTSTNAAAGASSAASSASRAGASGSHAGASGSSGALDASTSDATTPSDAGSSGPPIGHADAAVSADAGLLASDAASSKGGDAASRDASAPATAAALVASWTLGWNLGNSLDSNGCGASDETCWGNPLVTQALLNYVASLGFKVVRIPVTWYEHLGPSPAYTVDATWMARVETVVNYALDAGLDVILNVHHDGADSSAAQWLDPATTDVPGVTAEFTALWTQIATHFESYDERLVFESMNEIHHGYAAPTPAYESFVNNLNQVFVDTVRGTGGKNASRFLDVPGYNTNIDYTVASFVLPTDKTPNHLIVTYHYYDPYEFTIAGTTHVWGAAYAGSNDYGQETGVVTEFDKMKTNFGDKGVPVIMGEYSAIYQAGYENYRRYWTEYVTKAAHDRGITPIYWDAGQELVDRTKNALLYPDLMAAMTKAVTASYTLAEVAPPQ